MVTLKSRKISLCNSLESGIRRFVVTWPNLWALRVVSTTSLPRVCRFLAFSVWWWNRASFRFLRFPFPLRQRCHVSRLEWRGLFCYALWSPAMMAILVRRRVTRSIRNRNRWNRMPISSNRSCALTGYRWGYRMYMLARGSLIVDLDAPVNILRRCMLNCSNRLLKIMNCV